MTELLLGQISVLVSVPFLGLAAYQDLKAREVDDSIWIAYGGVGLAILAFRSLGSGFPLQNALISIAISIFAGLVMFYSGMFGGADSKSIICLALTVPINPLTILTPAYFHPFFPLTVLYNSFLMAVLSSAVIFLRNTLDYFRSGRFLFEKQVIGGFGLRALTLFTGYRVTLRELEKFEHLYPLERVEDPSSGMTRLQTIVGIGENRQELIQQLRAQSGNRLIWATPGLPMLVFLTASLLASVTLGDLLLSAQFTVLRWIFQGLP